MVKVFSCLAVEDGFFNRFLDWGQILKHIPKALPPR